MKKNLAVKIISIVASIIIIVLILGLVLALLKPGDPSNPDNPNTSGTSGGSVTGIELSDDQIEFSIKPVGAVKRSSAPAYAEEIPEVLQDLRKDPNFKETDYPDKPKDYSVKLISIGESGSKTLYVYVYQPAGNLVELPATSINISISLNDDLSYKNYKLREISRSGVFSKYKVEDLEVSDNATRYYVISSLFRAYDEKRDPEIGNYQHVSEVSYEVGLTYTATTGSDGSINYAVEKEKVIQVTDKYVGKIRYSDGFKFFMEDCDAHFIAFSTDMNIERLFEADIEFITQSYTYTIYGVIPSKEYGDEEHHELTLNYDEEVENKADGWGAHKYTWNRIEKVSDFIQNEKLTEEQREGLAGKEWILRFYETRHTYMADAAMSVDFSTLVKDVTLIRLKFETDGVQYNLGVVDNKQSGKLPEDGKDIIDALNPFSKDNGSDWKDILQIVLLAVGGVVIVVLVVKLITVIVNAVKAGQRKK